VARLRRVAGEGSWRLAYQPVVELATGRTVGAEALLRWPEDPRGQVEPSRFIPLAEDLGLAPALGAWVVAELSRRCRSWRADGLLDAMTTLTFNLSPSELWHPALKDRLAALRDAAGRGDLLVAEITESSLSMDPARACLTLQDIRELGIRVALDDFGTGYSSLARLQHLPIDVLKIDRSFLDGVELDPRARSIVTAMIRLALGLDIVPLAEGIETDAQLRFVTEQGCTLGQGFLFDPAIPAGRFAAGMSLGSPGFCGHPSEGAFHEGVGVAVVR
jgi:EAL domain-containing protein (putative c-di-GMP-specific phosphodiesterase class I)